MDAWNWKIPEFFSTSLFQSFDKPLYQTFTISKHINIKNVGLPMFVDQGTSSKCTFCLKIQNKSEVREGARAIKIGKITKF